MPFSEKRNIFAKMAKYRPTIRTHRAATREFEMDPDARQIRSDSELEAIYKKLCLIVHRFRNRSQLDIIDGISIEDLPSEIIAAFLNSPTGLNWDPARAPLEIFLAIVLRYRLKDRVKRQSRTIGSIDDPDFAKKIESNNSELKPQEDFGEPAWLKEIKEEDLRKLAQAISEVEDGRNVNEQIAEKLGISEHEVVNRKKRLKRYLVKIIPG